MFKIDLQNIQAIGDAHIVIDNNSITEFTGDNSNGKSVISKVIEAITSGDIVHKESRLTLIKDGETQGVVLFTHDKEQLGFVLRAEAAESIIMYKADMTAPESEAIYRPLNDRNTITTLVHQFGFRTYDEGSICLQLAPTFGAIPFVTTSGKVNNDIIADITTDKIADNFLKSFQTITFPVFKDRIARLQKDHDNIQAILDNMESYNWKDYESIAERMSEVYQAIKSYEYFQLESVPIPPLSVLPIEHFELRQIPNVDFYDLCKPIVPIIDELNHYVEIMNGVCPTCGKPLVDRDHTHE
jgi:hypothetical protein